MNFSAFPDQVREHLREPIAIGDDHGRPVTGVALDVPGRLRCPRKLRRKKSRPYRAPGAGRAHGASNGTISAIGATSARWGSSGSTQPADAARASAMPMCDDAHGCDGGASCSVENGLPNNGGFCP